MRRIGRPHVPGRRRQIIDVALDKLQFRQQIVPRPNGARGCVQGDQRRTAALALCTKLRG